MLRVTEEILLLVMDANSGTIQHSLQEHQRDALIAGAVLMDLSLENRIDMDSKQLFLVDPTPVGDDLLDPTLLSIAEESETHDTAYWVARTAKQGGSIREKAQLRLINFGILEADANGQAFPSRLVERAHRYPSIKGETIEDVRSRVMAVLFSDDIPSSRDVIIIGLAATSGVFESILSREELTDVRERIDDIARLDLMGYSIQESIRMIRPYAPAAKTVQPYEKIPEVPGLPIAGNAFRMAGDLVDFLTRCYQKYGPIFRIRAFAYRFITLVGPEANAFAAKISGTHIRSYEAYREFGASIGTHRTVLNMDGPEHLRMRKLQVKGYSPKFLESNLAEAHDIGLRLLAEWPLGQPMNLQRALQKIITTQIGQSCTGVSPEEYIDDIIDYLKLKISIYISKRWPPVVELWPKSRRLNRRMTELYAKILEAHKPENRKHEQLDYIDELLEMNRSDPQFLPETDLRGNLLAPFLVGGDTAASVCAFMLYSLLKHPDLLERMRKEVDDMYARGPLTSKGLRSLDVTGRVMLETLRMYPVIPAIRRTVSNSFEFAGYQVPAGAELMLGTTVAHFLPECFPDPQRFDIDRYLQSRQQHRQPGAFAPFGVGRHRCIGSSFSELLIILTMAIIVRHTDLVLDQPQRPLKINFSPTPHPHESIQLRLVRRRND